MEKKIFMFGFRYEKNLGERLRKFRIANTISLTTLVDRMLVRLGNLHDNGRMCLLAKSRFIVRKEQTDKVTTSLTLNSKTREMVRNLAFAYRISMAEVIRLGLEMYLDMEDPLRGSDNTIHIYREAIDLIHTVVTILYPCLPADRIPYPLLL